MLFLTEITADAELASSVSEKQDSLGFLWDIGDKISEFASDVTRFMDLLPDWLSTLIYAAVGVLIVILIFRLWAFIWDSIPFV